MVIISFEPLAQEKPEETICSSSMGLFSILNVEYNLLSFAVFGTKFGLFISLYEFL